MQMMLFSVVVYMREVHMEAVLANRASQARLLPNRLGFGSLFSPPCYRHDGWPLILDSTLAGSTSIWQQGHTKAAKLESQGQTAAVRLESWSLVKRRTLTSCWHLWMNCNVSRIIQTPSASACARASSEMKVSNLIVWHDLVEWMQMVQTDQ